MNYIDLLSKNNYWGDLKKIEGKKRLTYTDWLLEQSKDKNITALKGVRRSGKSTLLLQTFFRLINERSVKPENTLYVNFEDPRLSELLVENNLFKLVSELNEMADNRSYVYLGLDEIQNVNNWEAILRTILDQERWLKVYITGSSANLLGQELGSKLAGRYISTEVFPFSLAEYMHFTKDKNIAHYIDHGGFPDVVFSSSERVADQLLKDYFESILLRDIATRYNIRHEFKLRRLAANLFTNISNLASSYRLSKDLELSADTVLQYFSYIENAYLGFFVPKYSPSLRKQEYNPKKFYSIDTALQKAISFKVFDDIGKLFENLVFLELRRRFKDIFYWEEEKEVDFIVKEGENIRCIVNASVNISNKFTREREISSLIAGMDYFDKKESFLIILEGKSQVIETEIGVIKVINLPDFLQFWN
jgi:hypothetical protein